MMDLSTLSDEDLVKLYGALKQQQAPAKKEPESATLTDQILRQLGLTVGGRQCRQYRHQQADRQQPWNAVASNIAGLDCAGSA
jgi:hypothetical protein